MSVVLCAHSATYWHRSLELPLLYILLKCVYSKCTVYLRTVCRWSPMSSPITSIMIICAHWPNKTSIDSCQSSARQKKQKKHTQREKERAITVGAATVDSIAHPKQQMPLSCLSSAQNAFLWWILFYCVIHIFRLSTSSHSIHFKSHTIYSIYFWPLTLLTCSLSPPCRLLIFDLLFGRYSETTKTICSLCDGLRIDEWDTFIDFGIFWKYGELILNTKCLNWSIFFCNTNCEWLFVFFPPVNKWHINLFFFISLLLQWLANLISAIA